MKRFDGLRILGIVVGGLMALTLGMGPKQAERPPQPFFQDFFSGLVTLDGKAPPDGTLLVACIGDCNEGFESPAYLLDSDGSYDQLEVNPEDEALVGHAITFYLVNEFGRISALETRPYVGVFDFYVQNLSFVGGLPSPNPTPAAVIPEPTLRPTPVASLPVAGDPSFVRLPKVALIAGVAMTTLGVGLMFAARRHQG